jgi:lipoyl(octanoyl) transferase
MGCKNTVPFLKRNFVLLMPQKVVFQDLGRMPYREAWDYQEQLLQQNVGIKTTLRQQQLTGAAASGEIEISRYNTQHHLLFVEHPPVYTLGKSGDVKNILITEAERIQKGIEYYPVNRGGDITFHGPQQLVGYPIFDLEKFETDIGKYLRKLEEVIILTLAEYGLKGDRSKGETGVWLDPDVTGKERKICAMGVRCSRWITMHGFALNVNTDLSYFDMIVPCGIENKQVTSLQKETGETVSYERVKDQVKRNFETVFDISLS